MDVNQDNRIPETPHFYSSWNMRLDYSSVQQHIFCPGAMVENIYKNTKTPLKQKHFGRCLLRLLRELTNQSRQGLLVC